MHLIIGLPTYIPCFMQDISFHSRISQQHETIPWRQCYSPQAFSFSTNLVLLRPIIVCRIPCKALSKTDMQLLWLLISAVQSTRISNSTTLVLVNQYTNDISTTPIPSILFFHFYPLLAEGNPTKLRQFSISQWRNPYEKFNKTACTGYETNERLSKSCMIVTESFHNICKLLSCIPDTLLYLISKTFHHLSVLSNLFHVSQTWFESTLHAWDTKRRSDMCHYTPVKMK